MQEVDVVELTQLSLKSAFTLCRLDWISTAWMKASRSLNLSVLGDMLQFSFAVVFL